MDAVLLGRADDQEVLQFCCCEDDAPDYIASVQRYVSILALRRDEHVVGLRDQDDDLIGIASFDRTVIGILPMQQPTDVRGWYLKAAAVDLDRQGDGISKALFDSTFEIMRHLDPSRSLIAAAVHRNNLPSIGACAKVGLDVYLPAPAGEDFHQLIGTVPGTTPPQFLAEAPDPG
jgi:GNAT superfamily N-acetyltransferase